MKTATDFRHTHNPDFFQDSWLVRERIDPDLERFCLTLASCEASDSLLKTIRQALLGIDAELVGLVWDIHRGIPQDYATVVDTVADISLAYQAEPHVMSGAMDLIRES